MYHGMPFDSFPGDHGCSGPKTTLCSPKPTIGTAECTNRVRNCARVGASIDADGEPLAITPLPAVILTASGFVPDDANRPRAGCVECPPQVAEATVGFRHGRPDGPQPRKRSERAAWLLLWKRREARSGHTAEPNRNATCRHVSLRQDLVHAGGTDRKWAGRLGVTVDSSVSSSQMVEIKFKAQPITAVPAPAALQQQQYHQVVISDLLSRTPTNWKKA